MKCNNCGFEVTRDNKFCTNCGASIDENSLKEISNQTIEEVSNKNTNNGNKLGIISLICWFFPYIMLIIDNVLSKYSIFNASFFNLLNSSFFICPIIAIILMIVMRIKYPNNKFGKSLMFFYIIMIILFTVYIIILMITCNQIMKDCY